MKRELIGLTLDYRDPVRTSRCIEYLLADGAAAVLVWDNSDDGGASVGDLRQRWQAEPRVVIEKSPRNLDFATGVNRGIEAILTRWPNAWIMLINNDAILHRGALAALTQALVNHPEAVIAYPRVDHSGRVIGTIYYQRHFALLSFDKRLPGSFPYPSGSALLIAPERIELPLFDEDFFMYGEDVMLGWRLGAARMAHVPKVLVWHEGSAASQNGSAFYELHTAKGHWFLAWKIARSRAERLILLCCRALSLSARAAWRGMRLRSFIPIRALIQGWKLASAQIQRRDR